MKEYLIQQKDKEQHGDITKKLNQILNSCKSTDEDKVIRFEKGEYHFYWDFAEESTVYPSNTDVYKWPQLRSAINVDKIKNLTIDGGESKFIMHGRMIALKVTDSENIRLKDFSWDFPCAGTLEMQVVSVSRYHVDFYIPKSFQYEIKNGSLYWFEKSPFSGNNYWNVIGQSESHCVVGRNDINGNISRYPLCKGPFAYKYRIRQIGENTLRINYLKPVDKKVYFPGMTMEMCTSNIRVCTGAFFSESKGISVENINVRYLHGFSFLTQMCENVSFMSCNFTPEDGGERKCTSFADHLHFSGVKGKVNIVNCNFSNAHDDPINIHGTFTRVKRALDSRTLILEYVHTQQNAFQQYHKGDRVVFYKRENLSAHGDEKEFIVESVINPLEEDCGVKEMKVTFTEDLPDDIKVPKLYAAENVTYTPEVYIGGCNFSHIPTRGILCTTRKKVLIENNVFDGMTMASIYLSNDCNDWYESGAIKDMTIRGNEFYIKKSPYTGVKAAIFIDPIVAKPEKITKAVHSNITIEDNIFHLEHESAVNAKYTDNLIIRNNRVNFADNYDGNKEDVFKITACNNTIINKNI